MEIELSNDEFRTQFKIDDLEICGILINIEQKFNVCLCLNEMMKLKYFKKIVYEK